MRVRTRSRSGSGSRVVGAKHYRQGRLPSPKPRIPVREMSAAWTVRQRPTPVATITVECEPPNAPMIEALPADPPRRRFQVVAAVLITVGLVAGLLAHGWNREKTVADAACPVAPLPVQLATTSKYRRDDPYRASLRGAAETREDVIGPIRDHVLRVAHAAHGSAVERRCATDTLTAWAKGGALTRMATKDAMLSRSRLVAELGLAAVALNDAGALAPNERRTIARWSEKIARETVRWFENEAGPVSRRNNHRLWAALAVATAGRLADRPELTAWARASADLGLCAVDANGHLPLELERGSRALRYHVYALRPLLALDALDRGGSAPRPCPDALERLRGAVSAMLVDARPLAKLVGIAQLPPAAASAFGPALRLPDDLRRPLLLARGKD